LLGDGIDVFNVTFSGEPEQIGSFDSFNANVGINEGIILGSGDVRLGTGVGFDPMTFEQIIGMGGNNEGGNSLGDGDFDANDEDLDQLSTVDTHDAAILEFDFTPTGDSISFRYVFASEEYNEYVCGTVNDAFGFFLSGPGISGPYSNNAANLALIPNTDIPVTINTVNNGSPGDFQDETNCENISALWDQNTEFYIDNTAITTNVEIIEYDGLTVSLRAAAQVICGETYHIKIAIADGGDTSLDSGVFLQKDSFTSEGVNLFANIESALNDSTVYEGCGLAEIIFQRAAGLDAALDINVTFSGSAEWGVDYSEIPSVLSLGVGETSASLFLESINDGIIEGLETVTFSVDVQACNSDSAEFTVYIDDTPLEVNTTASTPYCPGDDVELNGIVSGGLPPYSHNWSNTETNLYQIVNPLNPETYTLETTDACGNSTTSSVLAQVPEPEPLVVSFNDSYESECPEAFTITPFTSGGIGVYSFIWSENGIVVSNEPFYNRLFLENTNLSLEVTDECNSSSSADVEILIGDFPAVQAIAPEDQIICQGETINLNGSAINGAPGYTYSWSNNSHAQSNSVSPYQTRTYTLTVTDACGITATDDVTVEVAALEAAFSMEWLGQNEYQFYNESEGETSLLWSFGDESESTEANPIHDYQNLIQFYDIILQIENEHGCTDETYRTISPPLEIYVPNAFTPDYDGINDVFEYSLNGVDEFEMFIFNRWGEVIWYTDVQGEFWDGSFNNGEYFAQNQTYTWLIKVRAKNIFSEEFSGTVTIL
ncbi:MAG: choice-of-anchor L domain-containing protein, partial [Flavobacteriales bacterium]